MLDIWTAFDGIRIDSAMHAVIYIVLSIFTDLKLERSIGLPSCKVCPLAIGYIKTIIRNFNIRYLIPNDHFSHAECNISFQTIIFAVLIFW